MHRTNLNKLAQWKDHYLKVSKMAVIPMKALHWEITTKDLLNYFLLCLMVSIVVNMACLWLG